MTLHSHVEEGRALVALRDRVVWVALELRAADDMAPEDAYSVAALDGDHLGGDRLFEVEVARDVVVVDVLERVVRCRCSDAYCFAIVGAVHAGDRSVESRGRERVGGVYRTR
jgi:hypothetical protein